MCQSTRTNESNNLNLCRYCFKDVHDHEDLIHYLSKSSIICGNCRQQLKPLYAYYQIQEMEVFAFYEYNQFLEGMIFQYKEGRDTALKDVFFYDIREYIEKNYKGYTIVLMPSSAQKNKERGFYAMLEMTKQINLKKISPFLKTKDMKQSKQRIEARQNIDEIMILNQTMTLPDTPLLLLDDVMTSGSTLHRAYTLLKGHRYPIKIAVLALHDLLLVHKSKKCRKLRWKKLVNK